MKKTLLKLFIVMQFGCGPREQMTFEIVGIHLNFIEKVTLNEISCCLYKFSDTIARSNRTGISFYFDVKYIGNSGETFHAETKDSIVNFEIYKIDVNGVRSSITAMFENIEECQNVESFIQDGSTLGISSFNQSDYNCVCHDKIKGLYFLETNSRSAGKIIVCRTNCTFDRFVKLHSSHKII